MDKRQFPKYLFTTLPTNDLGLLTRSLPIACELRRRGREVVFCSPATAPSQLVAEAGFENLIPQHAV
jgi:UDP:flavonoid glycosyltransferase YjiC (YdhE family)